ncbi:MAG TPA: metalloregulator ArsR/SmtB family transcription factor [Bacteroidales bacterium]|jgi:DNA-binding transcriptional ArsR family regulator|nr:metalloregulator ArsR/SmtB family transcription factor [Bacteroidales bacterium]HRS18558.1 metalloregulator ArsR/SmtB family transcription factor [Bacteroidales bacterium]
MIKKELFDSELQEIAEFGKAISHPARIAILKFLAESKTCISGDISEHLPLSRTTVSQHVKELKDLGLIHGEIDGLKINYCLCYDTVVKFKNLFDSFFNDIQNNSIQCNC